MASPYHLYIARVTFPSGDAAIILKTITFPKAEWEVEKLRGELARAIGQNPDVVPDWTSIKYVGVEGDPELPTKVEAARDEIRKTFQDPETGEGLDTLNRLLANPDLSRQRAAEKKQSAAIPTEV